MPPWSSPDSRVVVLGGGGGGGGGGTTRLRFCAGVFVVFAGVGASEPGGVLSFVTGNPTWSRETTYAA